MVIVMLVTLGAKDTNIYVENNKELNQSQGGMCISGVLRVGVGVAGQGAGP